MTLSAVRPSHWADDHDPRLERSPLPEQDRGPARPAPAPDDLWHTRPLDEQTATDIAAGW